MTHADSPDSCENRPLKHLIVQDYVISFSHITGMMSSVWQTISTDKKKHTNKNPGGKMKLCIGAGSTLQAASNAANLLANFASEATHPGRNLDIHAYPTLHDNVDHVDNGERC